MMADTFPDLVRAELATARGRNKSFNSYHEGYAVLLEEVDEVWDEIKKNRNKRDPYKVLGELVQIAAMAQKLSEDMQLTPVEHAPDWT